MDFIGLKIVKCIIWENCNFFSIFAPKSILNENLSFEQNSCIKGLNVNIYSISIPDDFQLGSVEVGLSVGVANSAIYFEYHERCEF